MLAYTLQRLLTQQADIQRNMATQDDLGAQDTDDWELLATVPCLLSWSKISATGRGSNKTYVDTSRQVPVEEGTLLLPTGTDITEADRISQITDRVTADLIYGGIITINTVVHQSDHLEVGVIRSHIGV